MDLVRLARTLVVFLTFSSFFISKINAQCDMEIIGFNPKTFVIIDNCYDVTNVTELTPFVVNDSMCRIGEPIYFDISGRQVPQGNLSQGIYIVVEFWDNGLITSRKVFIGQ